MEEEIELIDYLRVIWKRRWFIIGGTIASMLAGLTVSLLLPKMYETTLGLKIGEIWGQKGGEEKREIIALSIDDPYRVAEIINSESFLNKVREKTSFPKTAYKMKKEKIVVANTIEGGAQLSGKVPLLVNITARANNPEKAVELASTAADLAIKEHTTRFDQMMGKNYAYEKELEGQIQTNQEKINEMDLTVKKYRSNPQVNAPAVILLQAQLEQKQVQLLGFIRELRDVRLSNVRSENTRIVFPPILPKDHVNPKTTLNLLIAGILGLFSSLMLAFFLEYLEQVRLRKKNS